MTDRNFGYLDADNRIVYAKDYAEIDGVIYTSPKAEHRARETPPKLSIVSEPPAEKMGVCYVATEFGDVVGGRIVRRYEERPIVAPVAQYDVSGIIYGLVSRGKWQAVREVLLAQGLLEAFVAAGTMSDDFPGFDDMVAGVCDAVGITAEERCEILHEAEVGV